MPHRKRLPRTAQRNNRIARRFLGLIGPLAVLGMIGAPVLASAGRDRPNVVVILADDQGWGDLSLHGNTNLATPRIDRLARQGARFDRFFV